MLSSLVPIEAVECAHRGLTLRGYLHRVPHANTIVVMLHGFTGHKAETHYYFKRLSDRLTAEGIAVLRMDYAGSGDSDGSFADLDYQDLVKQAHVMIKRAQGVAKQVHLLGFSLGGAVALGALNPAISGLILIAPALNMHALVAERFKQYPRIDADTVDLDGLPLHRRFLDSLENHCFESALAGFSGPITVIWGARDQAVPVTLLERLTVYAPTLKACIIDKAGHTFDSLNQLEQLFSEVHHHFFKERDDDAF